MLGDKMSPYFDDYLCLVAAERRIEIEDVRAIRTVLSEEIAVTRDIIEKLIDLDRNAVGPRVWYEFLSDTIADFAVWVEGSLGKVSAETSEWMIATLRGASGVPAPSAARVIEAVIAQAEEVSEILTVFAVSLSFGSSSARPSTAA
jgi:hypothetical protein